MIAHRAVCDCGDTSGVLPSKPAARQWSVDHNDMHEALDTRRVITFEEVMV